MFRYILTRWHLNFLPKAWDLDALWIKSMYSSHIVMPKLLIPKWIRGAPFLMQITQGSLICKLEFGSHLSSTLVQWMRKVCGGESVEGRNLKRETP